MVASALTCSTIMPRLLDLEATAAYLNVSTWTVRDLEAGGILRRVRVPLPRGGELRKLLFDRTDLDRLVEAWKDGAEVTSRASGRGSRTPALDASQQNSRTRGGRPPEGDAAWPDPDPPRHGVGAAPHRAGMGSEDSSGPRESGTGVVTN